MVTSSNLDLVGTTIEQVFNLENPIENYYNDFISSVMGVYFWNLGRWDQLEEWDFWPIHVITIGKHSIFNLLLF